jgi:integrase
MARPRSKNSPSYRLHKQSGQAVVTLTDPLGSRKDVLLGKYETPESRVEYNRVVGEWEARGRRLHEPACEEAGSLSVNELMLAFLRHAEQHYRRADGTSTNELNEIKAALKPLKELYGTTAVAEFGPLRLKAVRQRMADARRYLVRFKLVQDDGGEQTVERHVWEQDFRRTSAGATQARRQEKWHAAELVNSEKALSRGVINNRIDRVVRMFKWAVSEELAPESVWRALTTVRGLEQGRTDVRETEAVKPVPEAHVLAVLPHATPPVAAMLELQLLTGMRPGEARVMRGSDLDTSGEVWLYRPAHHKTRHKGKDRVVAIGPRGQEIVRKFLKLDTQAYLFTPRDAIAQFRARQRADRKTKVQPSQRDRRRRKPKKQPGECYTMSAYAAAVGRACVKAGVPHFHPHQLRHTHATEVRRRFGLEAAQVALGHSQAQITEVYAERDHALAAKVARQIG